MAAGGLRGAWDRMAPGRRVTLVVGLLVVLVVGLVLAIGTSWSGSTGPGPTGSGPSESEPSEPVAGLGERDDPAPDAPDAENTPDTADTPDDVRGDDAVVLQTGTVTNVVDGDTVDLDDGTRVRLAIVDTPEVHGGRETCGREASAFTAEAVHGEQVSVLRPSTAPRTDPFDRLLGEVVRDDGWSLNVGLAAAGLGTVDERFTDEDPDLARRARAAQAEAAAPSCEPVAP